jgi:hypothetical protein
MTPTALADAGDLIREVAERLRENGSGMADDDILAALAATRELSRLVTQVQVEAVAELQRRGTFAAFGYPKPDSAGATMLTVDRGRAKEIAPHHRMGPGRTHQTRQPRHVVPDASSRIHSTNWQVRIARDGLPEFIPPAWLIKDQKPMRHPRLFHSRTSTADQEFKAVLEQQPTHAC